VGLHIRPTDSGFDLFVGFNESTTDKGVRYFKNLLYNLFLTTLPAFVQCCSSLWYTIKTTHQSTWAWATPNQFALVEIVIQMYLYPMGKNIVFYILTLKETLLWFSSS
jgi:hypothetical protein